VFSIRPRGGLGEASTHAVRDRSRTRRNSNNLPAVPAESR
jgi:hypothetical protein